MNLRCACCGGNALARKQWWNQDTGYGVCPRCYTQEVEKMGEEWAQATYGKPGIHHTITKEKGQEL